MGNNLVRRNHGSQPCACSCGIKFWPTTQSLECNHQKQSGVYVRMPKQTDLDTWQRAEQLRVLRRGRSTQQDRLFKRISMRSPKRSCIEYDFPVHLQDVHTTPVWRVDGSHGRFVSPGVESFFHQHALLCSFTPEKDVAQLREVDRSASMGMEYFGETYASAHPSIPSSMGWNLFEGNYVFPGIVIFAVCFKTRHASRGATCVKHI